MIRNHSVLLATIFAVLTFPATFAQGGFRPDQMNPTYRFYCERIIRNLAEHYKDNPAVIGWQIDNETPPGGAANKDIQDGFVEYLQHKFKTVDELNKNWGLNYWGQRLNDWT